MSRNIYTFLFIINSHNRFDIRMAKCTKNCDKVVTTIDDHVVLCHCHESYSYMPLDDIDWEGEFDYTYKNVRYTLKYDPNSYRLKNNKLWPRRRRDQKRVVQSMCVVARYNGQWVNKKSGKYFKLTWKEIGDKLVCHSCMYDLVALYLC